MHTPQGHEIIDGVVVPVDWLAIIFNPSFPYRLAHMSVAAFLATAFFVGASAAWHLLRGKDNPAIRKMLSMAMWMALLVAPVQAVIGDFHGLNTLEYQPAKIAAMEGHWDNSGGGPTPLLLFGWPDMEAETRYKIEIPYLASLILNHSLTEPIPALKDFPPEDRPNSTIVFWTFRIMVALGLLMIITGIWSLLLRRGDRLYSSRAFLRMVLLMGPSGIIAILAGWYTTEIGRQPWVIYGLMRTADAVSNHGAGQLGLTLAMFVVVYFAVFGIGMVYVLRLVKKGPVISEGREKGAGGPGEARTPMRPISAADEAINHEQGDQLGERN